MNRFSSSRLFGVLFLSALVPTVPTLAQRPPRPDRPALNEGDRAFLSALQRGEVETVKAALEQNPDLLKKKGGPSLLYYAVNSKMGDDASRLAMTTFLLEKGADPNDSGPSLMYTPLILAIQQGRADLMQLLLQKGADPNKADPRGRTPLQYALEGNKNDAVLALVNGGVDLKSWNSRGLTPLHVIATTPNSDPKIVALMLQKGAEVGVVTRAGTESVFSERSERGLQAIHLAAGNGNTALVKLLLEKGAALNAKTLAGDTPLHRAARTGAPTISTLLEAGADAKLLNAAGDAPLHVALRIPVVGRGSNAFDSPERTAMLKALIAKSDLGARGQQGLTPLLMALQSRDATARNLLVAGGPSSDHTTEVFDAASQNDAERLKKLLAERPFLVSTVLPNGWTPLHMAARWNAAQTAALLLEKGADPNARDAGAASPLHRTLQGESVTPEMRALVNLLVEKGADVNARSDIEPFAAPNNGWKQHLSDTPLGRAILLDDRDLVALFLKKGANLKTRNEHRDTPLMVAVKAGKTAIVPLLLEAGVNIEAADEVDISPLHRAVLNGQKETVKLLIEKGANINTVDSNGTTLLMRAAMGNDKDLALLLLARKADPNAKTNSGETAIGAAKRYGNTEFIEFLKQNGATE